MNLIEAARFAQIRNMQRLNMKLCALLFLVTMTRASSSSSTQELEIQNHLKKLNKPAVKSIQSPDGDTIDCVHILQQPAFDHPDLKNHKIQLMPKFHIKGHSFEEFNKPSKSRPIAQLWHKSGSCPEGTIPIRRTKKDDILRASSVQQFGKKPSNTIPQPKSSKLPSIDYREHEYAVAQVDGQTYYGTEVEINVWNPHTQRRDEFSLAQLWILSGHRGSDLNTIEAGWQVCEEIYQDNKTRLFIYWTNDSYQNNGCYNHVCPGFVQVSNQIALGGSLQPSSSGGAQSSIKFLVRKETSGSNWWLQLNGQNVGYWPGTLFPYLSQSASMVQWGGEIINKKDNGQHTTTQMGSGHFPEEGPGKAAFFNNIQVVDGSNQLKDLVPSKA